MQISATIRNGFNSNEMVVSTNNQSKAISIPSKPGGFGSAVNGGELLMLALAVCYCNDIYREASKRNIQIAGVEVEVTSDFGAEGETGTNIRYKPTIQSNLSPTELQELIKYVDGIAEIHNTLRRSASVELVLG